MTAVEGRYTTEGGYYSDINVERMAERVSGQTRQLRVIGRYCPMKSWATDILSSYTA